MGLSLIATQAQIRTDFLNSFSKIRVDLAAQVIVGRITLYMNYML